jgi:hypothetical protein
MRCVAMHTHARIHTRTRCDTHAVTTKPTTREPEVSIAPNAVVKPNHGFL